MPRRGAARTRNEGPSISPDPVGRVRRAQLVTTYGVGALIAAEEQSFVVAGIDRWAVPQQPDLHEFRLQRRLRVAGFHRPPAPGDEERNPDGVHVRRFPDFYTCPGGESGRSGGCEYNLAEYRRFDATRKNECSACGGPLTPSRFVVACDKGHLDDFPYWDWVHRNRGGGERGQGPHRLAFTSSGRTSALRSIVIRCSCGASASMEGSFGRGAMRDIGYRCSGRRPWLGRDSAEQGCDALPRALQRGSSSAWFAVMSSALSIPPFTEALHRALGDRAEEWAGLPDTTIATLVRRVPALDQYSVEDIIAAIRQREAYGEGEEATDVSAVLREEEYRQLLHETATPNDEFETELAADEGPVAGVEPAMLVNRLREVRALHGFTRVDPPAGAGDPRVVPVHGDVRPPWLPAVEVVGEGVFLRLDTGRLEDWEQVRGPRSAHERAAQVLDAHEQIQREHGIDLAEFPSPVTSRLMLVHSLAHALINEWSLEAGYPAASLRERLYVSEGMAGLLVYTATSDSAGSLGGLVERGKPEALRRSLESAIRRARWCSADPLCIEAEASGADALNLAACHACMLLPETSCEYNNTFLDRALLIGTPDDPKLGYFSSVAT
ncbi:DrmB family protein [Actinomycetospora sp. CA-084318]|uniref:DrmB family protein n=1 Tax=Actinomycetospora sp. CA-084318 TaxID=3239892 RepID=UPI003D959E06